MITVYLSCRLGNILFQYAAGRHLAVRNGTGLRLDASHYPLRHRRGVSRLLDRLFLRAPLAAERAPLPCLPIHLARKAFRRFGGGPLHDRRLSWREEVPYRFDPDVLGLPDGASLRGFFQHEGYFRAIAGTIREDLAFLPPPPGSREADIEAALRGCRSIGVHVRRGDYLSGGRLAARGEGYYAEGIRLARERAGGGRLFVFSDDIDWCRERIRVPDCRFVTAPGSLEDPVSELRLLSLCDHAVISNSSFSWWGAWLGDHARKVVVAPAEWRRGAGPGDAPDGPPLPAHWLRVEA